MRFGDQQAGRESLPSRRGRSVRKTVTLTPTPPAGATTAGPAGPDLLVAKTCRGRTRVTGSPDRRTAGTQQRELGQLIHHDDRGARRLGRHLRRPTDHSHHDRPQDKEHAQRSNHAKEQSPSHDHTSLLYFSATSSTGFYRREAKEDPVLRIDYAAFIARNTATIVIFRRRADRQMVIAQEATLMTLALCVSADPAAGQAGPTVCTPSASSRFAS